MNNPFTSKALAALLRRGGRATRLLAIASIVLAAFLVGFAAPALVLDAPNATILGGLVNGPALGSACAFVGLLVLARFGWVSRAHWRRASRLDVALGITLSALAAGAFGTVTGAIALTATNPTATRTYVLLDDLSEASEPFRREFASQLLAEHRTQRAAGVEPVYDSPSITIWLTKTNEALTDQDIEDLLEIQRHLAPLETRLARVRSLLEGRRGDEVRVLSAWRLPVEGSEVDRSWHLPSGTFGSWIAVKVLVGELRGERAIPLSWSAYANPALECVGTLTLESKPELRPTLVVIQRSLDGSILSKKVYTAPAPGGTTDGTWAFGEHGNRYCFQFPLERFPFPTELAFDFEGKSAAWSNSKLLQQNPRWCMARRIPPTQILVQPDAKVRELLSPFVDLEGDQLPVREQHPSDPATSSRVEVVTGGGKAAGEGWVDLVPTTVDGAPGAGEIHRTPAWKQSALGGVSFPANSEVSWPRLAAPTLPAGAVVLAEVSYPDGGIVPLLWHDHDAPRHLHLLVPNAKGALDKGRCTALAFVFRWAAATAVRAPSDSPVVGDLFADRDDALAHQTIGKPAEHHALLGALWAQLFGQAKEPGSPRTPGNSIGNEAMAIGASVFWGTVLLVLSVVLGERLIRRVTNRGAGVESLRVRHVI